MTDLDLSQIPSAVERDGLQLWLFTSAIFRLGVDRPSMAAYYMDGADSLVLDLIRWEKNSDAKARRRIEARLPLYDALSMANLSAHIERVGTGA